MCHLLGLQANPDMGASCPAFHAPSLLHSVSSPADEPLRHFLDDLRGLYPAFPTLLHTLLAALSATAGSGV